MKCKDPCIGSCGLNTECHVYNHIPQCTCLQGFVGNPFISCHIYQTPRKNYLCFYNTINNNLFLITNLIYHSKHQNYIYNNLIYVKIIYYKLDFKYRSVLLVISIFLNLQILANKIQRRL